jgi:hypothetical protein
MLVRQSGPWVRIYKSRYARAPIYFGRNRRFRFDAPSGEYGVLYLGSDLYCAFIETLGWHTGVRYVSAADAGTREYCEVTSLRPLRLLELSGAHLPRLGADARLFAGDHAVARAWSLALWRHPAQIDGIYYPSRHDNHRHCVAVFERDGTAAALHFVAQGGIMDDARRLAAVLDAYGLGLG